MSNKVSQENNRAEKIAGRDNVDIHNYNNTRTPISHLLDKFEKEEENDDQVLLDQLAQFKKRDTQDIRGLDEKLNNSSLSRSKKRTAKIAKENYSKNLDLHIHSQSAQKIHYHFLSEVYYNFQHFIKPQLASMSESEILDLVDEKITQNIMKQLERNLLDFNKLTALGTLYFLTGNCHINWDEE